MMLTLSIILMLRLIPYALVALIAFKRGYRWLMIFGVYLVLAAIFNETFQPSAETRAIVAILGSPLLLFHALDLNARARKSRQK